MRRSSAMLLFALGLVVASVDARAQACPTPTPAQGAPLAGALSIFPADNWWNVDIRPAPVDPGSGNFIAFINNGGTRRLHPDFGGEESPGSVGVYGFPYATVDAGQARLPVSFEYWDESDGVDPDTGEGLPFYPIPAQAISQAHWIEGGAPGTVDQRSSSDRHLLVIDCVGRSLYELYNVWYDSGAGRWLAGSGAYFDLTANHRRPDGWTSADAAGLAIFPGLVRYDEAANLAVPEINHAFRVTVRATNGYVYPASHRAGSTSGALPMGARLRLKQTVDGLDPALRTSDPTARKIFRAMQKYGLIVADNGSDLYISGTFDVRWNNSVLNPAFRTLTANDFEVVQLGWQPAPPPSTTLQSVSASPNPVVGGQAATGTVQLSSTAGAGGVSVALASASPAFSVPASVTVPAGQDDATFAITTAPVTVTSAGSLSASHAGITRSTVMTVSPATALPKLSIADVTVTEGNSGSKSMKFTIKLSAASATPVGYDIATANGSASAGSDYTASTLVGQVIPAGQTKGVFSVVFHGDALVEANETFTVNLGNASGATISDGQATGTLRNDDGPTLSVGDASVVEGNSGTRTATFTIRLSQPATVAVGYSIASANGSAKSGSDYVATGPTPQTIAAGQTQRSFSVTINGDTTVEANETLKVNLSAASGASVFDAQGVATLINDDGPTLSISDASVVEGDTGTRTALFTVALSQPASVPVRYSIKTANGSASAGSDYLGASLAGETIAAGQPGRSFAVTIIGDVVVEPDQTFKVKLSAASGATLLDAEGIGTIVNDD